MASPVDNIEKSGGSAGWSYNETNMTYNQLIDPDTNLPVKYNGLGTTSTITNQAKSA